MLNELGINDKMRGLDFIYHTIFKKMKIIFFRVLQYV